MQGAIWNARYYDPKSPDYKQMTPAQAIDYAATREGVHVINEEEARYMTSQNAFQYIAQRRGVEHFGDSHDGLFNAFGKADLPEEIARASASNSIMWKGVLSLTKEDADRLGYTNAEAWRSLLCRQLPAVAQEHGISPANLVWCAAFHPIDKNGSDHHPHVHVYMYSTDEREGRRSPEQTKRAFEKTRSLFTNDIFSEDLALVKEEQTLARQRLKQALTATRFEDRPDLLDDFKALSKALPATGRKGSYQYLPRDTKLMVDQLFQKIITCDGVRQSFDEYIEAHRKLVEAYNSDPAAIEQRMNDFHSRTMHPTRKNDRTDFHNAIIRTARSIGTLTVPIDLPFEPTVPPSADYLINHSWDDLSFVQKWEIQKYVGVSAYQSVRRAAQDPFMRKWLSSLYDEYGSDLSSMMKHAQKDTWKSINRQIRTAFSENDALQAAVKECRIYLAPTEQTTSISVDGLLLPSNISGDTVAVVDSEIQRILHNESGVTDTTASFLSSRMYEQAVRLRIREWFASTDVKPIFEGLESKTHAVLHFYNRSSTEIQSSADGAVMDAMTRLSEQDPEIKEEWRMLMLRCAVTADTKLMDALSNEALLSAYRIGVGKQLRTFYQELHKHKETITVLSKSIPYSQNFDDLNDDQKTAVRSMLPKASFDKRCEELLIRHAMDTIRQERIQNHLQLNENEKQYLQNIVKLQGDHDALAEDPQFCRELEPVMKIAKSRAPELQHADPVAVRKALCKIGYDANRHEQFQKWIQSPAIQAIFDDAAKEIRLTDPQTRLPEPIGKRLEAHAPPASHFDEKGHDRWVKDAIHQIERSRMKLLIQQDPQARQVIGSLASDRTINRACRSVRYDDLPSAVKDKIDVACRTIQNEELQAYAAAHGNDAMSRQLYYETKALAHQQRQMQYGITGIVTALLRTAKIAAQQNQQKQPSMQRSPRGKKKSNKHKKHHSHSQERSNDQSVQQP